jgi:hypothetical protein
MHTKAELIENYLCELEDSIPEQAGFEDSLHGVSEDEFYHAHSKIERYIEEYKDKIDIVEALFIPNEKEKLDLDCSIFDYVSLLESSIETYLFKENLKKINPEIISYVDLKTKKIYKSLNEKNINIEKYSKELNENISNSEELNQAFCNIVKEYYTSYIRDLFNKDSLNKNHLFKHYSNLLNEEIQNNYEKMDNENRFYNGSKFLTKQTNYSARYVESIKIYRKYIHLYKNYNNLPKKHKDYFNVLEESNLEKIDDFFIKIINKNKIKLFAKRFLGSYLKLLDSEGFNKFEILKDNNVSPDTIRKELENIALYKESHILNLVLDKIIQLNTLSSTEIIKKVKDNNLNADILYNKDNVLAVTVNDFEASSTIGSNRWCISTSAEYFKRYQVKNTNQTKKHVFLFDFSKKETNPNSKIGFTIHDNGTITDAFNNHNISILKSLLNNTILKEEELNNVLISHSEMIKEISFSKKFNNNNIIFKEAIESLLNPLEFISKNINKINKADDYKNIFHIGINKTLEVNSNVESIKEIISYFKILKINPEDNLSLKNKISNLNELEKIIINKELDKNNLNNTKKICKLK